MKFRTQPYIVSLCLAGIQPAPGTACEMKTLEGKPFLTSNTIIVKLLN